jgi:Uri superfamily endonuclease
VGRQKSGSGTWPAAAGSYALVVDLAAPLELGVGSLGCRLFPAGRYAYLGSAHGPGGLAARLARHGRQGKVLHWHIDYLTEQAPIVHVVACEGERPLECDWAQRLCALPGATVPVPGFGSSDCRVGCPAHLIRLPDDLAISQLEEILLA